MNGHGMYGRHGIINGLPTVMGSLRKMTDTLYKGLQLWETLGIGTISQAHASLLRLAPPHRSPEPHTTKVRAIHLSDGQIA